VASLPFMCLGVGALSMGSISSASPVVCFSLQHVVEIFMHIVFSVSMDSLLD
jgi:hypothetical protein